MSFEHLFERGDAGSPTLLLLHATGGDEHQLVPIARTIAPGATLLAPRGQVMENGVTRRFFARRSATDLDIDDLHAKGADLAEWVRGAATEYDLGVDGMIALGYSNGANMAVELLMAHPGLLAGAVLLRPVLAYDPGMLTGLDGTDVLLLAGEHDPYAAVATSQRLAAVLGSGGAAVDLRVHPGGHEVSAVDIDAAGAWLAPRLGRSHAAP